MNTKSLLNNKGNKSMAVELSDEQQLTIKSLLLDICIDIMDFCEINGYRCALGGGTALGAVRHQGFIPWDDDIDLNMPRDDYNRFIKDFSDTYSDKYDIYVPDGIHQAATLSMKVSLRGTLLVDIFHTGDDIKLGVNVDVFPIENVPNNRLHALIKGISSEFLRFLVVSVYYYQSRSDEMRMLFSGNKNTLLIYNLRCFLGKMFSFNNYQWWFHYYDLFVQYNNNNTKRVTIPTGRKNYLGEIMDANNVFPFVKKSFENQEFFVYKNVDYYLSKIYGSNYLKIPPEDKREKHFFSIVEL